MSLPTSADRWHFLTEPLAELLDQCGAWTTETDEDPHFMGGIREVAPTRLRVCVPAGQDQLEREGVVRGLLAHWFGVDTTDWPVAMEFAGEHAQRGVSR